MDRRRKTSRLPADIRQQDRSPTNSYDGLIYFLIAIKAVEVILGPVYDYLDGKWLGHSLRMNEAKRVAFRNRAIEEKLDVKGWRVERKVLLGALGQLSVMIVVAWAVSGNLSMHGGMEGGR